MKSFFKQQHKIDKAIVIVLIIFVIQTIICMKLAVEKNYLFTDEVFSYGLSNSEHATFIDPFNNSALLKEWQSNSFFRNYTKFDTTQKFSLRAPYENQANDVHPPIYYCLLHILSAFFPDTFYSAVPGILLNIFFLFWADLLLYYIAKKNFKIEADGNFHAIVLGFFIRVLW